MPAAQHNAFAGEIVRSRTFRRRYTPEPDDAAGVLAAMNTILHERGLEEYYCTLTYASFYLKRRSNTSANAASCPVPIWCAPDSCRTSVPGMLGSFAGAAYMTEITFALLPGDTNVFCTDGVSEALFLSGEEFGDWTVLFQVVKSRRHDAPRTCERDF